jgi:hypothetical protein
MMAIKAVRLIDKRGRQFPTRSSWSTAIAAPRWRERRHLAGTKVIDLSRVLANSEMAIVDH